MVSTDGANFRPALLPEPVREKELTILDTRGGVVVLAIKQPHQETGNIYVSDETGTRYTRTLMGVVQIPMAPHLSAKYDYEWVRGGAIDGVYIANIRLENGTHHDYQLGGTTHQSSQWALDSVNRRLFREGANSANGEYWTAERFHRKKRDSDQNQGDTDSTGSDDSEGAHVRMRPGHEMIPDGKITKTLISFDKGGVWSEIGGIRLFE